MDKKKYLSMEYSRSRKKKKSLKKVFADTPKKKKEAFVANYLLKKLKKLNINRKKLNINRKEKKLIVTWSRASTIVPEMVGYTIGVHNGKEHLPIYITESMLYHKLGDFVPTRVFPEHPSKDPKNPNKNENKIKRDNKTRKRDNKTRH
uniref:Small ribosomal subunit protein uS19c n=1 Tax=Welwitschia mirabilis TaxID=3377 RepID=B2Y200_WELMI|nr:ribosomal protein S19 [Welwitschia mirabilis]ABY26830.1 no product specified [Welwitschia mirabilis]AMA21032.1 ribosomal protein S19 [Welwitschia mirabilis]BAH11188.1 ribosomal protein S19 [Welwitschia mirabilis]